MSYSRHLKHVHSINWMRVKRRKVRTYTCITWIFTRYLSLWCPLCVPRVSLYAIFYMFWSKNCIFYTILHHFRNLCVPLVSLMCPSEPFSAMFQRKSELFLSFLLDFPHFLYVFSKNCTFLCHFVAFMPFFVTIYSEKSNFCSVLYRFRVKSVCFSSI